MAADNPYLQMAQQAMRNIPHNHALGMEVTALGRARATLRLAPRPEFRGDPQRGLYFPSVLLTLADAACGMAFISALGRRVAVATLDLRIDYLRPVASDTALLAAAHCHRHTERIGFLRCEIRGEAGSEAAALVNASFMRTASREQAA